jgi:hypothetical protein
MPALAKCSPETLKSILLEAGWKLYNDGTLNWSLVRGIGGDSLEIPKKGKLVSFEVLYHCLEVAQLAPGDYFDLINRVEAKSKPSS